MKKIHFKENFTNNFFMTCKNIVHYFKAISRFKIAGKFLNDQQREVFFFIKIEEKNTLKIILRI